MTNKKGLENKGNKGILTRQTTQNHPELKQQVDKINKEANIFGRKPRVTRSPPRKQLSKFSSHTYVKVLLDSKTEENTEKISIPMTSKADLKVVEKNIRTIYRSFRTKPERYNTYTRKRHTYKKYKLSFNSEIKTRRYINNRILYTK